jgi:hypothetical protein
MPQEDGGAALPRAASGDSSADTAGQSIEFAAAESREVWRPLQQDAVSVTHITVSNPFLTQLSYTCSNTTHSPGGDEFV